MNQFEEINKQEDILKANILKGFETEDNDIEKGQLDYAFGYGENKILIDKTGEEIKKSLSIKKTALQGQLTGINQKMVGLAAQLTELGATTFESGNGATCFNTAEGMDDDTRRAVYNYNDMTYACKFIIDEIKIIDLLNDNFNDKKTYKLNIDQIKAISC